MLLPLITPLRRPPVDCHPTPTASRLVAIGWEACEEIERVRAEVLQQRGYVSSREHLQIYARREAGGMDHRHAYQHATAVLVDEIVSCCCRGKDADWMRPSADPIIIGGAVASG